MNIEIIKRKVRENEYEFAYPHFFEEMANDDLTFADFQQVIQNGNYNELTNDLRGTRYEITGL